MGTSGTSRGVVRVLLCLMAWGAGCDGGGDDPGTPDARSGADASSPDEDAGILGAGGESFTVDWGPVTAEPGEEDTRCVVKRLGNELPIRVGAIRNALGTASHHMIVYRTSDTEEQPDPFPCTPFVDTLDPSRGAPLTISQVPEETIQLPEGVAFTLEPNQMVRLELHYINVTPDPLDIRARSTFFTIDPSVFEHEADFLFIGDLDISIPPRESLRVGPTFFRLPPELADSRFFSLTGHTHQHGTDMQVHVTDGPTGPDTPVYTPAPFHWEEPETVYHDPPFTLPPAGGFRFHCDYTNTSDVRVGFGDGFNDEMCFFWAYYFPSRGAKVCGQTDEYLGGVEACCPGSPLCSAFRDILF